MTQPKRPKPKLPKQTVVNVFVISRVPENGAEISYSELFQTLSRDLELAKEKGFEFEKWSKVALRSAVRAVFARHLLSCSTGVHLILGQGRSDSFGARRDEQILTRAPVSRNERTERYMKRVPPRIRKMIDGLPASNILLLLAGMAE